MVYTLTKENLGLIKKSDLRKFLSISRTAYCKKLKKHSIFNSKCKYLTINEVKKIKEIFEKG
jgi:hypothetical protein